MLKNFLFVMGIVALVYAAGLAACYVADVVHRPLHAVVRVPR